MLQKYPSRLRTALLLPASALLISLCGCVQQTFVSSNPVIPASGSVIYGVAHGGLQPVTGATVQLYAVGTTSDGGASTSLLTLPVITSINPLTPGAFTISTDYTCPTSTSLVYITITGGSAGGSANANIALMAAIGQCGSLTGSTFLDVNEVTTVAAVYALAPFMTSYSSIGSNYIDSVALASDFLLAAQYANTANGTSPGPVVQTNLSIPTTQIYTIANVLSACVNSTGGVASDTSTICGTLFNATTAGSSVPTDTIGATLNLANNSTTVSVSTLYGLITGSAPYAGYSSSSSVSNWSVATSFVTTSPLMATGDARTVTKPTYPAICATLTAQFPASDRSPAGQVPAASDDTTRIQAALDSAACKNTGKSVELASDGGSNTAFFSGLITATGEGLIIDSGVTLFGNDQYVGSSELVDFKGVNSSLMGPGTVDGRSDIISTSNTPRLIEVNPANGFVAYNVTLMRALHPALYVEAGTGITIWNVTIRTPANQNSADAIDVDSSTNVTVTNNSLAAGDDGVAVKTNSGNVTNVTIQNNRLYGTHGLTVGSILKNTVQNILFQNNYVYGNGANLFTGGTTTNNSTTANAINIKVVPCTLTVTQVTYLNTCITTAKADLRMYDTYATCSTGGTPTLNDIVVNGVLSTSSNSSNSTNAYGTTFQGNSSGDLMTVYLANVSLDATALAHPAPTTQYSTIYLDNVNFTPSGTGITTPTWAPTGSVPSCAF